MKKIISVAIFAIACLAPLGIVKAEPVRRGSCSMDKKAPAPRAAETTYSGENGNLVVERKLHDEMRQTHRATVLPKIEDVPAFVRDKSPVRFNGVVRGSNHKNQYLVVVGETVDENNARLASNED